MKITAVDTHTQGQPTRIVVSGIDELAGDTMDERRRDFRCRYDHLRTGLLGEPRGHLGMYGCVLTEPCNSDADFGALFMSNSGYDDVSGGAATGVATALIETGIIEPEDGTTELVLDTPAGLVTVVAEVSGGRVECVAFRSVPAWVAFLGASLKVPGHGEIIVDVGYGGSYFVWAWAEHLGVDLAPANIGAVIDAANAVMRAANEKLVVRHPETGDRCLINVATILDAPHHDLPAVRNLHVLGPGQYDRSPGCSGAGARLAVMHGRGEIQIGEEVVIESAHGGASVRGSVRGQVRAGARNAVVTEVVTRAFVTGIHDFVFDADDPLNEGFLPGAGD